MPSLTVAALSTMDAWQFKLALLSLADGDRVEHEVYEAAVARAKEWAENRPKTRSEFDLYLAHLKCHVVLWKLALWTKSHGCPSVV